MTGRNARITAAIAAGGALAALAGCAPVQGTGSAAPSEVSQYQSVISSSRAAESAAATKSACASWRSGYDIRRVATVAMNDYTRTPDADWTGIVPTLNANIAAVQTESAKLEAVVTSAQPNPSLQILLRDYRSKLDAYGAAIKLDQNARGLGDRSWVNTDPAGKALTTAVDVLITACS